MFLRIFQAFVLFMLAGLVTAQERLSIKAQELDRLSRERRVVVLDARPSADYEKGHIPGALSLPYTATFEQLGQNGRVFSLSKAQTLFSELGLKRDDVVVVYDAGPMMFAARVLWTLEVYGHDKVRLLDGGLKGWQMDRLPLNREAVRVAPTRYVPTINPQRLATRLTTLVASRNPDAYVVLDARKEPHYLGVESEARRFGHIPGARGIAMVRNFADDGIHLKTREQLAELYKDLPKNKKIVAYCNFGLISSLQYMILRDLGYDVANYDASWKEWGNDDSLPIVEPAKKRAG